MPRGQQEVTMTPVQNRRAPVWMTSNGLFKNDEQKNWKTVTQAMHETKMIDNVIKPWNITITDPETGRAMTSERMMLMSSPNGDPNGNWEELKPITKRYNVVTKQRIGEILDPLCELWPLDAVGTLHNGGRSLFSLYMGKSVLLDDNKETIDNRLIVMDDYRGGSAITVVVGSVRLYCMNQFAMLTSRMKNRMSFPHIGEPDKMLELRVKIEQAALNQREESLRIYEQLMRTQITQDQTDAILEELYPDREEEPEIAETNRTLETEKFFKPHAVSDELLDYSRTKATNAIHAWQLHRSRVNSNRLAVVDLFKQFNDEHTAYADTAYALLNVVNEFADWRSGRGKDDRAMQTLVRGRAGEKRRAMQMVMDRFGIGQTVE